jgi:hypothetical protein
MLTLFGATQQVLMDWFAVEAQTLEQWAAEHPDFRKALEVQSVEMTVDDFGLCNWFKDYWLGHLR